VLRHNKVEFEIMATPGTAPQAHSPSVSRLDDAISALAPLDAGQLQEAIWDRLQHPYARSGLPRLGRDEDAVDILVDIALYSHDEELSERLKSAAGSLLKKFCAVRNLPDVNPLGELCYLCGQTGSRNSLDGLSQLIQRDDAGEPLESSVEPLRLRALRCLVGLLSDFQDDIDPAPYRHVLEACLQRDHCEKIALIGLTGLWPSEAEAAQYTSRIEPQRRPRPGELRLGLRLAGFDKALASDISFLQDESAESERSTGK
jgi:hypothetical protein